MRKATGAKPGPLTSDVDVPDPAAAKAADAAANAAAREHPAPAQAGQHPFNGWFVATRINSRGTGLICTYYWFRADGHVHFGGPPANWSDEEFAALEKSDPRNSGTYGVVGEKMTLQHNGGQPEVLSYTPRGGGILGSDPLQTVWRFADAASLDGSWGLDSSSSFGHVTVVASDTWTFHRDGTFEHNTFAGVDSETHKGFNGGPAAGVTGAKSEITKGKYQFAGGARKSHRRQRRRRLPRHLRHRRQESPDAPFHQRSGIQPQEVKRPIAASLSPNKPSIQNSRVSTLWLDASSVVASGEGVTGGGGGMMRSSSFVPSCAIWSDEDPVYHSIDWRLKRLLPLRRPRAEGTSPKDVRLFKVLPEIHREETLEAQLFSDLENAGRSLHLRVYPVSSGK